MPNEDNELQKAIENHHNQLLNQDKEDADRNGSVIEDLPLYRTSINQQSIPGDVDDGKHLLYPDIATNLPLKTSDRLLDDILCDTIFSILQTRRSCKRACNRGYFKRVYAFLLNFQK